MLQISRTLELKYLLEEKVKKRDELQLKLLELKNQVYASKKYVLYVCVNVLVNVRTYVCIMYVCMYVE